MKHANFLKNVAVISAGGIAAKGIGALYRIFLVGGLGSYGMGLYQMTYPLFCFLLTFSSAGIPSAFSRIVANETARGRQSRSTLRTTLLLFSAAGLGGAALMCLFAPAMARIQGDENLYPCYLALAPSVLLVAAIAVLRGYFQGKNDMAPTALSEVVEQLVKASLGLYFANRYAGSVKAVIYSLGAVTVSEAIALAFLLMRLQREKSFVPALFCVRKTRGFEILKSVLPVMIAAAILPLSQTVDSVLLVRLLPCARARAVSLYGLFTGGAISLVNLPATACYGLSAATVPAVSARFARGDEDGGRKSALFSLAVTLVLSGACALGLFALARPVVALLYPSLAAEDAQTLVSLIRMLSVSAVTLAGASTLSACLTGMGRAKKAAWSMAIAVAVKTALQFALVPVLSVTGAAIAANACYMIAFSLDLFYTVRKTKRKKHDNGNRAGNGKRRLNDACENGIAGGAEGFREKFVASLRRVERRRNKL